VENVIQYIADYLRVEKFGDKSRPRQRAAVRSRHPNSTPMLVSSVARYCLKTTRVALTLRALIALGEGQKPQSSRRQA
jgi:hypothetical protein